MKSTLGWKNTFYLFLLILGVYRVTLIDRGIFSFFDETRYDASYHTIEALKNKEWKVFCKTLTYTKGFNDSSPGDGLVKLLPASIQYFMEKHWGIPFDNPISQRVLGFYNVIISLCIVWFFYQISLLFLETEKMALLATVCYSLLANSNLYIRHAFPYDASFLVCIGALYSSLNALLRLKNFSMAMAAVTGLLAAFSFAIYPGFYFFIVLLGVLIVFNNGNASLSMRLKNGILYTICLVLVLLLFEGLSRLGGTSYFANNSHLATTIVQGSLEENFSFLFKYLWRVEYLMGLVLLILAVVYIIQQAQMVRANGLVKLHKASMLPLLFFTMLLGYVLHASGLLYKMVFYGRLMHIYLPFVVWAGISALVSIQQPMLRRTAAITLVGGGFVSFLVFAISYYPLAYPKDVLYKSGVNTYNLPANNLIYETPPAYPINSAPPKDVTTNEPYTSGNFLVVNSCYFFPIGDKYVPYVASADATLLYKGLHFLGFEPYTFEGFSIEDRKRLRERQYEMKIFVSKATTLEEFNLQAEHSLQDWINRGVEMFNKGDYLKCIGACEKAIALDPNNALAYNNECTAYGVLFLFDEAVQAAKKAIELDPKFELAKNNLNDILVKQNNPVQKDIIANNYLNLSTVFFNLGNFEKCIEFSRKTIVNRPTDAIAFCNICASYNALQKWGEAETACLQSLKLNPDFSLAKNNYEYTKSRMKKL